MFATQKASSYLCFTAKTPCEFSLAKWGFLQEQRTWGMRAAVAVWKLHSQRRLWADNVIPLVWFLPGSKCMRGGAVQDFASDRHFHRGIHLESTLVEKVPKSDSRSKACEITTLARWILFSEAT